MGQGFSKIFTTSIQVRWQSLSLHSLDRLHSTSQPRSNSTIRIRPHPGSAQQAEPSTVALNPPELNSPQLNPPQLDPPQLDLPQLKKFSSAHPSQGKADRKVFWMEGIGKDGERSNNERHITSATCSLGEAAINLFLHLSSCQQ